MPARGQSRRRLVHPGSGRVLASRLEVPRTFLGRGLGLMFRRTLEEGAGMWISPCNGIHTFFMRFPIDAVFLDRRQRVVRASQTTEKESIRESFEFGQEVTDRLRALGIKAVAVVESARPDRLADHILAQAEELHDL